MAPGADAHRLHRRARENGPWVVEMRDEPHRRKSDRRARGAGQCRRPLGQRCHRPRCRANAARNVRLVKGSHIIVPKFWEGRQAYMVQNHDKRVIFINPYENDLALIGTTDIPL